MAPCTLQPSPTEEICLDFLDRRKSFAQVVAEWLEAFLTANHYTITGKGRSCRV